MMRFHQKRFFAYPNGAPSLHTLSSVSSRSLTLVTTDRSVSLLSYGDSGYSLHKLEVDALQAGTAYVIAQAGGGRTTSWNGIWSQKSQVAVAYAVGEALFMQVLDPHHEYQDGGETAHLTGGGEFALEAATTCMFSAQSRGTTGGFFYGVVVCCTDAMVAFGYVEKENMSTASACTRLDNEQFAAFFSEFATFSHTILAVDSFTSSEEDQGWIAFGCADGLVRVFHGHMHEGCLGGPFKTKDLQLNGPVTSVALFPKRTAQAEETTASWRCNLLVTCAIGQAVVYEDLFSTAKEGEDGEVLMDSDTFDSIFAGVTADIDLDGELELLLGTDSQVMLAYKEQSSDTNSQPVATKDLLMDESTASNGNVSPDNIWSDEAIHSTSNSSSTRRHKWMRLSRSHWDLETFGAIYSLLWRDVNHDGVLELLVASSTGIYVYEADPVVVIQKLEQVLSAIPSTK